MSPSTPRHFISSTPLRSTQGYGDGKGDPRGENPQAQGKSNSTKENAEHPGPKAPADNGSSGKKPEDASAESGGSRSKEAKETGSSPTGGEIGGETQPTNTTSKNRASPRIHDENLPGEGISEEKQAEVEKHNEEFEQRYDRAQPAEDDKVDEKFWTGELKGNWY